MKTAILHNLPINEGYRACTNALLGMGARKLGEGYFATAYSLTMATYDAPLYPVSWRDAALPMQPVAIKRETRVIKLTKEADPGGFIAAAAAMRRHKMDPHAPLYYGLAANDEFWAGELEILSSTKPVASGVGGHGAESAHIIGPDRSKYARTPCEQFIEGSPFLQDVLYLAEEFLGERDQWNWDIHGGNVMMRGNQAVITDPVCCTKGIDLGKAYSTIFP